ncbi:O-antigen ligase [soil metagenome]
MSETATEFDPVHDDTPTDLPRPPVGVGWRRELDRWRPHAIWIATTAMFLMVTKGPVFKMRFEAAAFSGDFIDDPWVQAAFVSGAAVVIVLCLPAASALRSDPLLVAAMAAFIGMIIVSGLWSVNSARSVEQGVMMAVGTVAALLAGASMSRLGLVTALAVAVHAGVLASIFARWREWPLALDRNDDLAGVYFNRNSLGPVALIAAITAGVLLAVAVRERRWLLAAALVVFAVVDLWVWWMSGSLTPVFGVIVAGVAVAVFVLTLPGPGQQLRRRIAIAVGGGSIVFAVSGVVARSTIASRLDRSPTLSGRTEIWDVVMQFVGERPVQGWGFLATWTRPEIIDALADQYGREVFEAHSGFFEVLLGVGVVGLLAMIAAVSLALLRTTTAVWRDPDVLGVFLFGAVVYAVALNFGETMVGANLLPWTLLAVGTGRAVHELGRPST